MNDRKMLDVKKMCNYSVTDKKENESLVFFYYCYKETWIENEPFGGYDETKNEQFFETYQEALDYIDTLEIEED